jgi:Acetyltransferase (isoleucine patch superfamily)
MQPSDDTPTMGSEPTRQRERMLAGLPYRVDDELLQALHRAHRLCQQYAALFIDDHVAARRVLESLLGYVGEGVVIRPPLYVDYGSHIRVGAGTFINFGLVALDVAPITIGEDVRIGPNVQLLPPTHPVEPVSRREGWEGGRPIVIGDNVWIGGGAILLPGVTIGENSVIGAGAVVARDVDAGVVVAGNPARVIRTLD